MAQNKFLPFATGQGADVAPDADYQAAAYRQTGFGTGTATSTYLNKVWRQASIIAATIGQFIADKSGQDALDNGDLATLLTNFELALGSLTPPTRQLVHSGVNTGTANALVANVSPDITAYENGSIFVIDTSATNTGAVTANLDNVGAVSVLRNNGSALSAGDLPATAAVLVYQAGSPASFILANPAQSPVSQDSYTTNLIVGGRTYRQTAPGTYSFTVPTGVYAIGVEIWGAGGGGAGGNTGGGGGGSGYVKGTYAVNPGDNIAIVVGAGGAGGSNGNNGSGGGSTSVGPYASASGGAGGASTGAGGNPGSGYSLTANAFTASPTRGGGAGVTLQAGAGDRFSGAGGQAGGAGGGSGQINVNALQGDTGNAPGGGGNGSSNNPGVGGNGASGEVRIYY